MSPQVNVGGIVIHAPGSRFGSAVVLIFVAAALSGVPASAAFQTVDYPSAGPGGTTFFSGVSNGREVGTWSNATGTASGSFVYSNGTFTPLVHPNAHSTTAFGIAGNNVVGYFDDFSRTRGFVFDGANWTDFDVPTSPPQSPSNTYPEGIDAAGTILGLYDTGGPAQGFVRSPSGTFTALQYPGSTDSELRAVGPGGKLIGNYTDSGGHAHGFAYGNNVYTSLDYPGAAETSLFGSDGSRIVGAHYDQAGGLGQHGLLYDGTNWTNFDAPGATGGTGVAGIDGNTIVGFYADATGTHAFITSVPEPSALALLAGAGMLLARRARICRAP